MSHEKEMFAQSGRAGLSSSMSSEKLGGLRQASPLNVYLVATVTEVDRHFARHE